MTTVSYTEARVRLASLLDEVVSNREEVIIKRRGHPDVALIAADELSSLQETVHLLKSPANGIRLLRALQRSYKGEGHAMTLEEIKDAVGASHAHS
jgi:antitoxin YefM